MSKRKLLLADDSITIQKVVNLTFADEGIDVITVGDGDSAIAKIAEVDPDVVLADVHMPGLNGYQVCEMIRQNPGTRELPVVLLVGSFEPFDESEAARVGANAYLTKPFQSIRQLVSQVSELMSTSAAPAEESFRTEESFPSESFAEEPAREEAVAYPSEETERADNEVPDTTDIDSLYERSFGAGEESAESGDIESGEIETGPPRYVDAGMDDEMIETTHATGDYDRESVAAAAVGEAYSEPEREPEPVYEQPVHEASGAFEVHEAAGAFESYAREESPAPEPEPAAEQAQEEPQYFDQFAKTEQIPADESQRTTDEYELNDAELLELPPLGPDAEVANAAKQVVNLSPELMEIIVQRVVEKLAKNDNQR